MKIVPVTVVAMLVAAARLGGAEIVVTNTTDAVDGDISSPAALGTNPGSDGVSLREALAACNGVRGPHTISFAAALASQTIVLTSTLIVAQDGISIVGNTDAGGRPGVALTAPDLPNPLIEVQASDFALLRVRFVNLRQVVGLNIKAGAGRPQILANVRIEGNEFVGGDVRTNQNAISVGMETGSVDAIISNVLILDNTFRGFSGDGDGVHVPMNGTDGLLEGLRIEGNRFEDTAFPVELVPSNGGARNRIAGPHIARNTFLHNLQAITFLIGNSPGYPVTEANVIADAVIEDNLLADNATGIGLNGGGPDTRGNQIDGTQILRNAITGGGLAIVIGHGGGSGTNSAANNTISDTLIADNTETNNLIGIYLNIGAGTAGAGILETHIVHNMIASAAGSAISVECRGTAGQPAADGLIADTLIERNKLSDSASAIIFNAGGADATHNEIANTEIAGNLLTGIFANAVIGLQSGGGSGTEDNALTAVAIVNNTIADNPLTAPAIGGGASGPENTVIGVHVANTIFWNNGGDDMQGVVSAADVSYSLTSDPAFADRNGNLAADPLFVSAMAKDYHLRPDSPAVDSATSVGAPTRDLDGRERFDDVTTADSGDGTPQYFDRGAFEFDPTPFFTTAPASQAGGRSQPISLGVETTGTPPAALEWQRNGETIAGATNAAFTITSFQPADAGLYVAIATNTVGRVASEPAICGLSGTAKVTGDGSEIGPNIRHPNGNVYDQVLLQGVAATVTADPGQIVRMSFVDSTKDIVQVEFSGAGSLSLVLDEPSGPMAPENYNQPNVAYMKGRAGIVVTGSDETTNLTVFSVGRANAVNQALFKDEVAYDGMADLAFVAIQSANGRFGGLRTANATFYASRGLTGVYAPGVQFAGPVFVGEISAFDDATPVLIIGASPDTRITGGDLFQANGQPVKVSGLRQLKFTAGSTSHGAGDLAAQANQARLEEDGIDVTDAIVVNPSS